MDRSPNGPLLRELLANHPVAGQRPTDLLADLADGALGLELFPDGTFGVEGGEGGTSRRGGVLEGCQ
jgi:hypothetical protein